MSLQEVRRRRRRLSWIPTIIVALASIGLIATAGVLVSNGLGEPAPEATAGQVTDRNWSVFTTEGLAYIDADRLIRIDASRAPIDASELGLPADGTVVVGPHPASVEYSLIVNGGAEGTGGDRFRVMTMSIDTANGVVTAIHAPVADVLNFRQTLTALERKATLFGWDTSQTDAIFAKVEDAARAREPYQFGFGPADAIGVPVSAVASCDASSFCTVEYVITPAVR